MRLFETSATLSDVDRDFVFKLYQENYGLVRKVICQVIGNSNLVEDLVNNTFIRLMERISLLRTLNCYKLNSYIVLTGKRVAINYLRGRERQSKYIAWVDDMEVAAGVIECDDSLEEKVVSQDEFARLKATIQCLPETLRDVLYFKYLLEMDDKEIAQELLISPDSVRQYLTRARRAARQLMEEEVEAYGQR